jgi:putative ABC transport system permease protein
MTPASDSRYALKLLLREKGFATAALLTLALCIGANAAVFSVLNGVLLRPLPFEAAERLVSIYNSYPLAGVERGGAAVPDYYDRQELPALEHVALYTTAGFTVGEAGRPERLTGLAVTPSLFGMLGVPAAVGRTFLAEEGEPGNERQAVLSWGLWQEQFGGAADALGRSIRIDEVPHTIVGVMPRNFVFHESNVRLWVPLAFTAEQRSDNARHTNNWGMLARLRPGATVAQAQQQVNAQNAAVEERLPQFRDLLAQVGFRTVVADYRSELTREVRGTLWLLQAGVLLVLLIGLVNIANLVLVRASARQRELATRAALGAAPARLARQLVTESLVLAFAGGLLGLALAWAAIGAFAAFAVERLPRGAEIALDVPTLLVALALSALGGLVFSTAPIWQLRRADLSTILRDEGRAGTAGRRTAAWRGGLVVAQVSLAFALLTGAGLMVASYARTLAVEPGFRTDVLAAAISLPVTRYPDPASRRQFADRLLEGLRTTPGIAAAAVTSVLPFGNEMNASVITPEGYEPRPDDPLVAPVNTRASDGYFETLGIELVAGRTFNRADADGAPLVVVLDRYLAERFWPGQDPLGRRIAQGVVGVDTEDPTYRTVVGVVENVRIGSLTGEQPLGHIYFPAAQWPAASFSVAVRGGGQPTAAAGALRAAVAALDPDLPLYDVRTMEERIAGTVAADRLRMLLLGGFGGLALFLAAVGLYGVLAYSVSRRTAEIGIRMALGSSTADIFRVVLAQGARLVALGLVLGLAGSLALAHLIRSMLYGVEPRDPLVLAAVLVLLAATAFVACVVPARRATRVDPVTAIREGA